ncbi:MAG: altronate dehydratase family protein [Elusimicrobiota bacterium]|jgi:altronate hydrolase|nr:altronate dehydratase family protein [Elusimicrobiota bacterium]
MQEKNFIKISPLDNVIVALKPLTKGDELEVDGGKIVLLDDIPFGHKIALRDIKAAEDIIKYAMPIGCALFDIKKGSWAHSHNIKTKLSGIENYSYQKKKPSPFYLNEKFQNAVFRGYKRKDGSVGIRNEIWIIPTVGCVNTTAKILEKKANEVFDGKTDGIFAFTHNMGCSQIGDDLLMTQKILAGLINNPNAGAVLVLGLGCENNIVKNFTRVLGDYDKDRVKFLTVQSVDNEYDEGLKIIKELSDYASSFKREIVGADKLVVGFKCGGSDAFSGISANPLCGKISDMLIALHASAILTETPEMFGAEKLLMQRAADENVFNKIVNLINNFKKYFMKYNQTIYENPSPGNKDGGITTLEEKSLGCVQKGGSAYVSDVIEIGEKTKTAGLNLLSGPGNDMVSCTNLCASGAQLILFTTGRGNPFGSCVPTIKISSNSYLYNRKKHWIDFNAGSIIEGESFESLAEKLFDYILNVASGEKTKNEINDYREISIFKDGVIL